MDGADFDPSGKSDRKRVPGAVLFMCAMNVIRSPMAEVIARSLVPGIYFASAGVRPGERDPFVDVIMAERGLTLGHHKPKTLEELEDDYFDLVITLSPEAQHKAVELTRTAATQVEYWPTLDPTVVEGSREQRLAAYRGVRDQLMERLKTRFLTPMAGDISAGS